MAKVVIRFAPIVAVLLGLANPAHAVNDKQIKAAINAAIAFLKTQPTQFQQGTIAAHYQEGAIGLTGIALLEAGVDPGDPHIQEIAKTIRAWAVKQSNTYQLAVDIIFLDKLGEDIDTTLIQSMGARLVRGQSAQGGWSYHCPVPDTNEQSRLSTALAGASMKGKRGEPVGVDPSTRPKLDPAVEEQLKGARAPAEQFDDNSNTQFALLGLWAARRHGLPVDDALARLDRRLRALQLPSGGWAYSTDTNLSQASTAPMTCAGLLGLAVTAGNRGERSMKAATVDAEGRVKPASAAPAEPKNIPNLLQTDKNVIAGFKYLGQVLNGDPLAAGPAATLTPTPGTTSGITVGTLASDLYFMWSLERVCMVYGVGRVSGKDWYAWGADQLVATQKSNGSWMGGRNFGADIDTSFALMFLCRSNIVKDLSNLLANRRMSSTTGALKPSTEVKRGAGSTTAKDPPDKTADPSDPATMAKALASATGTKYAELLKQYTDSKGPAFTQALAAAIPQLTGEAQKQARDALADRMARFSATTLKERLRDSDREMRCAAALAVCMRDEQDLVPDLIDAINDADDLVVRAARRALKGISDKDFGPPAGASAAQKRQAIADWKAWWDAKKKD